MGLLKTSNKGFLLATLEKSMKEWPGMYHLITKITPRFTGGILLVDI